jgi:hypothetical protein
MSPVLDRILSTERLRQRTAEVTKDGFARPILCEHTVKPEDAPFLVTNMRGAFLSVRPSKDQVIRFAFTECPFEGEGALLRQLYDTLWETSVRNGWSNRCTTLSQAKVLMESWEMQPQRLVTTLDGLSQEGVSEMMRCRDCLTEVDGLKVLPSDLLLGQSMLTASPVQVGLYVRTGEYLGILVRQANRSIVLVRA